MGAAFETIQFKPEACDGCLECMNACAQAKAQSGDQARARIQIVAAGDGFEVALCRQCADPECVQHCPATALTKNAASGGKPEESQSPPPR